MAQPKNHINQLLFLAAGEGKRLKHETANKPKPLVGVADKTLLDHALDTVRDFATFDELILVVRYLGEQIAKHVEQYDFPVTIREQERLGGTAHAVQTAVDDLEPDNSVLVVFPDSICRVHPDHELDQTAAASVFCFHTPEIRRYGEAATDEQGRIIAITEKPANPVSDLALSEFTYFSQARTLIRYLDHYFQNDPRSKNGEAYLAEVLDNMVQAGERVVAAELLSRYDCGTLEALAQTRAELKA